MLSVVIEYGVFNRILYCRFIKNEGLNALETFFASPGIEEFIQA